jgi:hypothetical protein
MVTWVGDGQVGPFGELDPSTLFLATNAMVDVGGISRLDYGGRVVDPNDDFSPPDNSIDATGQLNYTAGDFFSPAPGYSGGTYYFFVTMYIVNPAAFPPGVIPTAQQMMEAPGYVYETPMHEPPGTRSFFIQGPPGDMLNPNTKYWVMVIPTWTLGYAYDVRHPMGSWALSGANAIGRGVSIWTNRTPAKPVITSPNTGVETAPGGTLTFTYNPADPDEIFGNDDVAGVQVQYAARPTPDNPSPEWIDLPIANGAGTELGKGWYIKGSSHNVVGEGAEDLWSDHSMTIKCGSNTLTADQAALPSGAWQLRVRTFDYGSPYNVAKLPFGVTDASLLTPAAAPGVNTSPWSDTINVTINSQVPPPIPLSPINNIALADDSDVTLRWQYRNQRLPTPALQEHRTVDIRKVGDASWTTLVDEDSASAELVVTGFTLEETNQYEWRVQVTDTDAFMSNWSATGRFWVVPAPSSGEVRPVPTGTIAGATLGCGTHRAFIYKKGGKIRVGEITGLTKVEWSRVRDDISVAKVVVQDWSIDCGNLLSILQPWAYELVIYRDNGYNVDRVWEGPLMLPRYEVDKVTLSAKDVMVWPYRRIIRQAMNDSGEENNDTVVNRASRVLQNTLAPDDPNILAYLQKITRTDDSVEGRNTPAFSRTAFEEIDDMASNAGLDYTVVGRSILLWGTRNQIGLLPELSDDDLGASPIVSVYGMSTANFYSVTDGQGTHGDASKLNSEGNDPNYGIIEILSSTVADDAPADTETYSQEALQNMAERFQGYSERAISSRYPPPTVVRIPDNTTLNPDTVLSIQQLVPGVAIPLRSTGTLKPVVQKQKLDKVSVVEEGGKETISIILSPFPNSDAEPAAEPEEE